MAKITVDSLNILKQYISGVMKRADHHAKSVNEIALTIAGAVAWKAEEITVMSDETGKTKNALWLKVGKKKYALSYVHEQGIIELRKNNLRGVPIESFNNTTPTHRIKEIFENL